MCAHSDHAKPTAADREHLRAKVLGLGEASLRKSYYPQLRQRVAELEFHSSLLDAVSDSVVVHDMDGTLIYANKAACDSRGYTLDEMLGLDAFSWVTPEQQARAVERGAEIQRLGSLIFESQNRCKDGSLIPVEVHARVITHEGKQVILSVIRDLTERLRTEAYIHGLAYYDPLTKLANRTLFRNRLEMAIARASRSGESIALMFLDLDHFKMINDTFGHQLGDDLLRAVAERLLTLVRDGDTVARFGGDEFTLLLDGVDDASAHEIAQRTLAAFEEPFLVEGHELSITTSIGIGISHGRIHDSNNLMRQADAAMYQAKSAGRSAYRVYDSSMDPSTTRVLLLGDLRRALERGEFELHYQPVIDVYTGRIVSAEALLRWHHPLKGAVSPTDFIPLAEESGMIFPLGEWVLREACRQSRAWSDAGLPSLRLAVNVSARQIYGKDLAAMVAHILHEADVLGESLELEVTESAAMKDTHQVIEQFMALRAIGVKVAIDDFGTGHSSLDRLKRFPVDTLKVDRSFICDVTDDSSARAIASSIIVLGQSLGLDVVAEGVETVGQLQFLLSKKCRLAQGYLYSPAIPAAEFTELLRSDYHTAWRRLGEGVRDAEQGEPPLAASG